MVTDAMIEAGVAVYRDTVSHGATLTEALPAIYTAMSAASVDDEMVERVAQSLFAARFCGKDADGPTKDKEWADLNEETRDHWRFYARAALAAVKLEGVGEPSHD